MEGERFAAIIFGLLLLICIIGASVFAYVVITADDEQEGNTPFSGTAEISIDILVDPDLDDDTWIDALDNCPSVFNLSQEDTDEDGIGDACDTNDGPSSFDLRAFFFCKLQKACMVGI